MSDKPMTEREELAGLLEEAVHALVGSSPSEEAKREPRGWYDDLADRLSAAAAKVRVDALVSDEASECAPEPPGVWQLRAEECQRYFNARGYSVQWDDTPDEHGAAALVLDITTHNTGVD